MSDKCMNHPAAEAVSVCADCQGPVCKGCEVSWKGRNLCPGCARDAITLSTMAAGGGGAVKAPVPATLPERPTKSKFFAFILAFVPGLGHWYLGLEARGLHFMVTFFGIIGLIILTGQGLLGLILGPLWLYSLSDTMWAFDELAYGEPDPDRAPAIFRLGGLAEAGRRRLVGASLVLVGIFSVLNNLPMGVIPASVEHWMKSNLLGVLLIGIGVWLITNLGRRSENGMDGGEGL